MTKSYKTQGIILRRYDWGEADRILIAFCRNYGKIICLAKGVRKLTSRKKADIEPFCLTELFLVKGKSLDILAETKAIRIFPTDKSSLKTVVCAWQLCEQIDNLVPYNQENNKVFDLLNDYLQRIIVSNDCQELLKDFKIKLLMLLGFGLPDKLDHDNLDSFIERLTEKENRSNNLLKRIGDDR